MSGENVKVSVIADTKQGSSPRERGKLADAWAKGSQLRLIPA